VEYGAIDLHKRESQVRIVTADGEIIDRRILTTRDRLTAIFGGRARMRILIEASTESEWVARHLESLGAGRDRGGSELRSDVRPTQSTRQDGSARRRGTG
jgi:hypothetical protein